VIDSHLGKGVRRVPFFRPGVPYSTSEVRAILDALAEGRNPHPPLGGIGPPAHTLGRHWALQEPDMKARTCAVGGPPTVSCFKDFDTVVAAVTAVLNSANGSIALQALDANPAVGQNITCNLPMYSYPAKKVDRIQNILLAPPNGTARLYRASWATRVFVRIYAHTDGGLVAARGGVGAGRARLWIQTAFPDGVAPESSPVNNYGAGVII
jgi:hypothetical protein